MELVPVGASSPVTSVAITCRTAPEEYELIPPVLVIPADANDEQVHRVVRCRINRGAKGPLYISSCPEHVRAKLREVDSNNWDIDIEVRPSDAEATTRVEFSAGIDKRPACTLLLKSVGSSKP